MSTHDFKIFTAFERPRYLANMDIKTGTTKVISPPPALTDLWP